MKKLNGKTKATAIVLLCAALVTACSTTTEAQTGGATAASTAATASSAEAVNLKMADLVTFDDEDHATDWSADTSTAIKLSGTTADISGSGAKWADGTVKITEAGTYVLSGTLSDGQVVVDAGDEGTVHLVLNGVDITDSDSAPVYIKDAGKVVMTLQEGTENSIVDGKTYVFENDSTDEPSAAIFSKADLTMNGTGSLSVTANYNDGITGKDDLKIMSGTISIQAVDDGIVGKDMLAVNDGTITIDADGDGMKSSNDKDETKGFVAIAAGTFDIQAGNDGIQAETSLLAEGGTYHIVTGGGSANAKVKTESGPGPMGQGGMPGDGAPMGAPGMTDAANSTNTSGASSTSDASDTTGAVESEASDTTAAAAGTTDKAAASGASESGASDSTDSEMTADTEESPSMKGIKAGTDLAINGGSFTIDTEDDAVHSNSNVTITGGDLGIATGDDGVHADAALVITDGTIDITKSYEGLEGADITVAGGDIHVVASDDGVNAAEGDVATDATAAEGNTTTGADVAEGNATTDAAAAKGDTTTGTAADEGNTTTGEAGVEGGTASTGTANGNAPAGRGQGGPGEPGGFGAAQNARLTISGGTLTVNADGDGLDSNGTITMTDGTVIVNGPVNDGNGALDYDGTFEISGGTLIAAGSAGMAQAPSDDSSQLSEAMTFTETQTAGTLVHLEDSDGNEIATFAPAKDFRSVIISSPDLKDGTSYTLYIGGTSTGGVQDGLYTEGEYEGGTQVVQFAISGSVTTWLNESGVTTGGGTRRPGGGMGGSRPSGRGPGAPQSTDTNGTTEAE
ncbi:carbohydrate-binding domain-containing protein [Paenibacillus jiagnxiensis]|uniref:carbohydrate-binding domain-containing protein n=1 Tax=Paenibacillus jiagnxiensis TaxID=3228926 RepID=UPI0033B0E9AB